MPVLTLMVKLLGVGADWPSTLHAGVGAELVEASHADLFLVFPHKFLSTEILATIKTVGTGCHSHPINPVKSCEK